MNQKTGSRDQKNKRPLAFLETIREQAGEGIAQKTVKPETAEIFSGPNTEKKKREEMREFFLQTKNQERLVFSNQNGRILTEIASIRHEILSLVKSIQNLDKQIDIAAKLEPVEPGVYHLNYFQKLKEGIVEILKRVDESAAWLTTSNRRAQKRNAYWGRVKKSGTKFMLSQERTVATQTN